MRSGRGAGQQSNQTDKPDSMKHLLSASLMHVTKSQECRFLDKRMRSQLPEDLPKPDAFHKIPGTLFLMNKKSACSSWEDLAETHMSQNRRNAIWGPKEGACGSQEDLSKPDTCQEEHGRLFFFPETECLRQQGRPDQAKSMQIH